MPSVLQHYNTNIARKYLLHPYHLFCPLAQGKVLQQQTNTSDRDTATAAVTRQLSRPPKHCLAPSARRTGVCLVLWGTSYLHNLRVAELLQASHGESQPRR